MIVTETLFTALTFVVLTMLCRPLIGTRAAAAAGFLTGVSVLVRPIALYVAIPLAIVIVAERRRGASLARSCLSSASQLCRWRGRDEMRCAVVGSP